MQVNELKPQPAVIQAVIQITRKDTGEVEEYTITGTPLPEPEKAPEPAQKDQA